MGNKYTADQIINIFCYQKIEHEYKINPLKGKIDSSNIFQLVGKSYYDVLAYGYFKKYDELHILHDIFKSTSKIDQKILIDRINAYYILSCQAINPLAPTCTYNFWSNIEYFKLSSTYPIFLLNMCETINSEQFLTILSSLLGYHIVKNPVLVPDQINFLKLMICLFEKSSNDDGSLIDLIEKIGSQINKYLNDDNINIELLNFLITINLGGKQVSYNNYKYIKCVLPNDKPISVDLGTNVERLSNNELFKLLIPSSMTSYNLWTFLHCVENNELKYIEKMKKITNELLPSKDKIKINYIFDKIKKGTFKNINDIGLYILFILRCFNELSKREVINIGKNIVDFIVENCGEPKILSDIRVCDIMREVLNKTSCDKIKKSPVGEYLTLLDYYLSTVSVNNLLMCDMVEIMIEKGMVCGESSLEILRVSGWEKEIKSVDLINFGSISLI